MKPQHLVPLFVLALAIPGYALAGSPKGCGCTHGKTSHVQKTHVQKGHHSKSSSCGCGTSQKGKGHATKGGGILQKATPHTKGGCSKGGCSSCCLAVIPAVLNHVDHVVSNAAGHVAAIFSCGSCGSKKSGHIGSKSKSCGCGGSTKVGVPVVPPNPFKDDDLQPPPLPSTEARIRVERRPIHRQVARTRLVVPAPTTRAEPRAISISTAAPLQQAKPQVSPRIRTISVESKKPVTPHNPLRAK